MSGLSTFQLVDAAVHFVPALVWAIVAHNGWRFLRSRRPHSRFFHMLPLVAAGVTFGYSIFTLSTLIPPDVRQRRPEVIALLYALNDWSIFTIVALARHMARYFPTPEEPPAGAAWLAVNYGSSVLMTGLSLVYLGLIGVPVIEPHFAAYPIVRIAYQLIVLGLIVWRLVRIARPGVWAPGGAAWVARRADAVFIGGALVSLGSWLFLALTTNWVIRPTIWEPSVLGLVLDAIAGVAFAVPLAVRCLGEVVRGFLTVVVMLGATATVYFGAHRFGASLAGPDLRALVDCGAIFALVLVLVPGQSWLRAGVDHVVFRRSRRRREELHAFVHTLSPELGTAECCRRALPEVIRVMRLRGAAMLLRDGETLVHGAIAFAPVDRLWRSGASAEEFPAHSLVGYELRELPDPLKEALSDTDVVGVMPIISPRQRWGVLLISTGLLGAAFSDEDEQVLQAFADQLALVLDGAELLARAVAVERSLAHSEQLAAIGELAARIAHEIRNPVTAARSLAQQLSREPASPLNAEHAGLILTELERVERQVAALLRFARREEFHFERVDLGELVQATVDAFRPRLEAAGVTLDLRAPQGTIIRADRDKIRQVAINLIENAVDALGGIAGTKQLDVGVGGMNGTATLAITDNGPGVPANTLQQLFEPFFSLKPNGTGLGLAIAKRTIDAHGGRIEAVSGADVGMTFRVDLPLAGGE